MAEKRWEVRTPLRWGSTHVAWFPDRKSAVKFAADKVKAAHMGGSVTVDVPIKTVYCDIYPEDAG